MAELSVSINSNRTSLLGKERSDRETQVAKYEIKIKDIEKMHRESMSVVQRSYDDLVKGKRKTDDEVIKLKQELVKQNEALKELGRFETNQLHLLVMCDRLN